MNLREERLGMSNKNSFGSIMKIVEYNNTDDIFVQFEHGEPIHTSYRFFREGQVKNPLDRSVFDVGYIGYGKYRIKENGKLTSPQTIWRNMLQRCYDEKLREKYPSYINCTVADEWHNFQNFAKWYEENYYQVDNEEICLDKDILVKGNKIYSPNTCIFAPRRINVLFTKGGAKRGIYPIGVMFRERDKKFVAQCKNIEGKKGHIGYFSTSEEAFYAYKSTKEKLIKQIAQEYKDRIPEKLYNALCNYIVEITD